MKPSPPFLAAVLTLLLIDRISAQNLEKIAPKMAPAPPGTRGAAPEPPPITGDTLGAKAAILAKRLNGIVLVDGPEKVRARIGCVRGLKAAGVQPPEPAALDALLSPYLGRPLSLATVDEITRAIVVFYRAHDRPVVDVVVPAQEITGGVLQLVVIESRLGKIHAEGNRWFNSRLLESRVRLEVNRSISAKAVESEIAWLNNNPFREVNAIYTPGSSFGTTDLILQTQDRFPVRTFAGYENTGNEAIGENRWFVGFNWGNVFGLDQQVSYQFTASDDVRGLAAHAVTYVAPLPWHHTLTLFGSYASTRANIDSGGAAFSTGGHSEQLSARYTIPLPKVGSVTHDVFAGFDFKRTNNDLEFGGLNVFNTNTDIFQWSAGYEASARDAFGSTRFGLTFFLSPGRLDGDNTDSAFRESRTGASARYLYGRAIIERVNHLPRNFSLVLRATGQWSSANLLASEQLNEGGYDTVRGYEEGVARGDAGLMLSAELRSPPVSLCNLFGWRRPGRFAGSSGKDGKSIAAAAGEPYDQLQLLAFFDYGLAVLHDPLPAENQQVNLASAGIGLRYDVNPYLAVRFDYGWQLMDADFAENSRSRGHVSVLVSF